jgi:hypothetical protein
LVRAAARSQCVAKLGYFALQAHDHCIQPFFVVRCRTEIYATRLAFAGLPAFTWPIAFTTSIRFSRPIAFASWLSLTARLLAFTSFGTLATLSVWLRFITLLSIFTFVIEKRDEYFVVRGNKDKVSKR